MYGLFTSLYSWSIHHILLLHHCHCSNCTECFGSFDAIDRCNFYCDKPLSVTVPLVEILIHKFKKWSRLSILIQNDSQSWTPEEASKLCFEICGRRSYALDKMIEMIYRKKQFLEQINALKLTPFDKDDETHQEMLDNVWSCFRPPTPRNERDWEDIGFQTKYQPESDFRGMGMLSLSAMAYLCKYNPKTANWILQNADFPFAITAINVVALVVSWLQKGYLDDYFYFQFPTSAQFKKLFVRVFYTFAQVYKQSNPRHWMDFPPIYNAFCNVVSAKLELQLPMSNIFPVELLDS